ncbi:MAG: tRNA (adenosine(37)-N6)-dimethylallyltransferase MiaA [Oscillospiraceae bacterium]|nr:tRNA (adenosine(37)-N6)-dimethylallyltransferase MiaA [Oscillospiraceae bacterium]
MRKILVITGPTAIGKSKIAILVSKDLNGEIISCDSMQIYKKLNIGSAKISLDEMGGVTHHLIDFLSPFDSFSAADFKELCTSKIDEILENGKVPILTGGTMMYMDSVIKNYDFTNTYRDDDYRDYLENLANEKGREYVHSLLREIDETSYSKVPYNNLKRVIRALEVYKLSGKPFSEHKSLNETEILYDYTYIILYMDRNRLYERIEKRVDKMLESGLVDEVISLKKIGLSVLNQSMQGIGYKEVLDYLDEKIDYEAMVSLIKKRSRNYAKRQLTWFRKVENSYWLNIEEYDDLSHLKQKIIDLYNGLG